MTLIRWSPRRGGTALLAVLAGSAAGGAARVGAQGAEPVVCDAVWHDSARGRDVPVRLRIPAGAGAVPVVLFSHGLGGSLDAGTLWAEAWSRAGFAVVHLQHPGSDRSLLEGKAPAGALAALRSGMGLEQLVARAADVHFVLDELGRRRSQGACDLTRIDLERVGMAGHSFGAITTEAVAGEATPGTGRTPLREGRIRAAVAFSPSPPRAGREAARSAFARISLPFFSITGTADAVPLLTPITPEQRTWPYRYMPPGGKYLLVLEGADHMVFNGFGPRTQLIPARTRAGGAASAVPVAHVDSVVTAATLAFWRAALLGDPAARRFLDGGGLRRLLAAGDRFERK